MITITLNGQNQTTKATTIPELLLAENLPETHQKAVAVARNGRVVARAEWSQTRLENGDIIEIVKPFVGG